MLTTRYVPGSPNWADLATPDIEGAKAFYGGVLGWDHVSAGSEFGGYGMFQLNGKTVAGAMQLPAEQAPPSWTLYFQTADAEATATAVKDNGGTVVNEPMDVRDLGRMTLCADAAGAGFATWQPGTNTGLEAVDGPGTLLGRTLHPGHHRRHRLLRLGLRLGDDHHAVPGRRGRVHHGPPGGQDRGRYVRGDRAHRLRSCRRPDRAELAPVLRCGRLRCCGGERGPSGGTTVVEPTDIEGVGRFAVVNDPYGARLALMQGVSQDA